MNGPAASDDALKCIRCGFCLDSCPTFRLTGNEADSPRGRIYLMRSVGEGQIPLESGTLKHLDSCLGCRACETACPSGVPYASILEQFREGAERCGTRPAAQRFARRQLLDTLTNPGRLSLALRAAGALEAITGPRRTLPALAAELLTGRDDAQITLPARPERPEVGRMAEVYAASGRRRYRVGMLAGCVMRVLFHETNLATVRVLQRNGCEVVVPRNARCCGALHLHAGYGEEARERARAFLDAVAPLKLDAFIVNSAGCGSTMKEYGEILAGDPAYAERARAFAATVRDVSEFLAGIEFTPPRGRFEAVVAYHDACHLAHGQRITRQPRDLLRQVPGLTLVDLPESDTCCGSAGVYNLVQPEMARRLLERKVAFIRETGATVVATGNPGCLAWIQQGLAEEGQKVDALHPVQILDTAYATD